MVSVLVSDITNPPPVQFWIRQFWIRFGSVCKAANATDACFYDVRVECVLYSSVNEAVGELIV